MHPLMPRSAALSLGWSREFAEPCSADAWSPSKPQRGPQATPIDCTKERSFEMSLKWYRRPRLVALNANTPVLEAARAIENNNIGGVVVQNKGRVVGIVTDRDLATRVVGRGLDPKTTLLSEVMTTPVVTLSPSDSQRNAIRFMQER